MENLIYELESIKFSITDTLKKIDSDSISDKELNLALFVIEERCRRARISSAKISVLYSA